MRKVIVKAFGLIHKIALTCSVEQLHYLQKEAKDFEIIEYREEKNERDDYI